MAISIDQQLETQTAGTGDWDSALNANFTILERGQHVTVPAGTDINTGHVCWINSGGYAFHYDPNSVDIRPHGYAYLGASSGDDVQLLVRGTIRSLDINSPVVAGINAYVSGSTPGVVVNSYSGSYPPVGYGIGAGQLFFDPHINQPMERITQVVTINPAVESMHLFTMDLGGYGWVREVDMKAESGDLIRLWFYSNSNRAAGDLLYQVLSGGVDATSAGDFGGFYDRAGWPFENTDASTINGLIYGTVEVHSLGSVNSTNLNITLVAERRG
jgi:hypothetical protein